MIANAIICYRRVMIHVHDVVQSGRPSVQTSNFGKMFEVASIHVDFELSRPSSTVSSPYLDMIDIPDNAFRMNDFQIR